MDPLSALRDFTIRGEADKIIRINDEFRFGNDYSFPYNAKTAYRSHQGSLYTLETLVYFIQNPHLKHTDYFQHARAAGVPAITFVDRKPLFEYLTGKLNTTDSIVFPLPQNPNPNSDIEINLPLVDSHNVSNNVDADVVMGDTDNNNSNNNNNNNSNVNFIEESLISMINSMERPVKDREALLECKSKDFYGVLVASTRREEERQRIESQQRKDGLVAKSRLMGTEDRGGYAGGGGGGDDMGYDANSKSKMLHLKGGRFGEGVPIILVPSAFQTLITIYNVKEFLEDGVYVPTDVKVKMKGAKPDCVTVQKKFSTDKQRVMTAYEIRDKPSALKPEDWDRVVAVFVLGKEWQFKDWPFKDHVEIFNKIIGFFMRFEDDSIESAKTVKQWNVKIISISKNKRHQDRAAALEVWDRLEEFVRSRSHS